MGLRRLEFSEYVLTICDSGFKVGMQTLSFVENEVSKIIVYRQKRKITSLHA